MKTTAPIKEFASHSGPDRTTTDRVRPTRVLPPGYFVHPTMMTVYGEGCIP